MLLTIDIGNSNIVLGLFEKDKLVTSRRMETDKKESFTFYHETISDALTKEHITNVDDVMIGSVVPSLDVLFRDLIRDLFKKEPLFADTTLDTGIDGFTLQSTPLGADLLANIIAAAQLYPGNSLIVDVGTATKFQAVQNNTYLGGAIAPGIGTSFQALIATAEKLEDMELSAPEKSLGRTTEEYLNSGYIFGFVSLIEGMVEKIQKECDWQKSTVIGTGGFIDLLSHQTTIFTTIDKHLTLQGLRILWERNNTT